MFSKEYPTKFDEIKSGENANRYKIGVILQPQRTLAPYASTPAFSPARTRPRFDGFAPDYLN
jgi:hypothetical protein